MLEKNAADLVKRAGAAFGRRGVVDSLRQEIALQFAPALATFTSQITGGEDHYAHLFDPTGALMARELGDTLSSLLRPDGRKWFRTSVEGYGQLSTEGFRFFDLHSEITRGLLMERKAGFVRAGKMMDVLIALFGESTMTIEERHDPRDPGLLYRTWHPSKIAFEESAIGEPETHFRRFRMSAAQLCRRFERLPGAHVHADARKMADEKPDAEIEMLHVAIPEEDYEYRYRKRPRREEDVPRFVSLYIDQTNQHVVRETRARWSPYVTSRWQMVPGLPDGFSPAAMAALPASHRLQQMYIAVLEAAEKQADPPIIATADAIIGGEINLDSGGVTHVDKEYNERDGAALRTLQIGGDMRVALEAVRDARETMAQAFYINKLTMPSDRPQTAYEASLRFQEYIRGSLPIVAPLEDECNAQILSRIVDIGSEVGAYDSLYQQMGIPEELGSREIVFEFENPLRDAMRAEKQAVFQRMLELTGAAAQFDQSAPQAMHIGEALRDTLNTFGQSDWVASEDELEQARQAQQQQQQAMAAMQQARDGAAAAKDGAQAMAAGAQAAQGLDPAMLQQMMAGASV